MKTKNYNHYDLNPPAPVIIEPQNPCDYWEDLIAEHNFETSYEETSIKSEMDLEEQEFKELIKNEQCII